VLCLYAMGREKNKFFCIVAYATNEKKSFKQIHRIDRAAEQITVLVFF
jgi:hypothetical protein